MGAEEEYVQLFRLCAVLSGIFAAPAALAADAGNGGRLAEGRCVTCHVVAPGQRREVADAPPFETIARKFAAQPDMLAFAIRDPHPRMNVTLTRREAEDIAAYINTLAK
jgi:mono/diheme cytochrome c family protein